MEKCEGRPAIKPVGAPPTHLAAASLLKPTGLYFSAAADTDTQIFLDLSAYPCQLRLKNVIMPPLYRFDTPL